jgi:hypothetical protein
MAGTMQILVKCPDCPAARMSPADVTLRNCVDDDNWSYRFTCASCGNRTVAPTNKWLALEVVAVGAKVERWTLPTELHETRGGPPITLDDLLDLHEALLEADWFDTLLHVCGLQGNN